MRKLIFLFYLFIFLFALQAKTSVSIDAVDSISLHAGNMQTIQFSNPSEDVLSEDYGEINYCMDMLEVSEGDIDKIILPALASSLPQSSYISPESNASIYSFLTDFWLDKPPQFASITI